MADLPPLSAAEEQVLRLYDQLQELRLEMALLRAQKAYQPATATRDIKQAQEELLQATSSCSLNRSVIENVLIATPIIKSVHSRIGASPIERDILPYVRQRDAVSIAIAKQSAELRETLDDLTKVESEILRATRENASMTSEVLELAEAAKRRKMGRITGPAMAAEMEEAEKGVKESRRKWKVIKGTASAVVVGSGVDWVGDPSLRDIVLDPEDDG